MNIRSSLRGRILRPLAVALSVGAALVAATGASALPWRFDTGIYDPVANQAGKGREWSSLAPDLAMQKTLDAGSRFVRIPVRWDRIVCGGRDDPCTQSHEPTNPANPNSPEYKWARNGWYDYEAELDEARQKGLEPVLSVFGVPPFAQCDGTGRRPGGDSHTLECDGLPDRRDRGGFRPDPSKFAAFMTALAKKYPWVEYYEIWNEPNYAYFLQPARKPETINRYRDLVNAAYDAIKANDQGDVVIAGATSPNGRTTGTLAYSPMRFLRGLVSKQVSFDAYSTHPYTPGGPRRKAPRSSGSVWMGNLGQMRRVLNEADRAGKIEGSGKPQFWVTEFSWDSAPPDCRLGRIVRDGQEYILRAVPSALLTRWVSEASYRMWRQGVSALIWAQIKDSPVAKGPHQGGLYVWGGNRDIGNPKPARQAFKFPFVAYPRQSGAYVWGRLPTSADGEVVIEKRARGTWRRVEKIETFGSGGLFKERLRFNRNGASAMRARVPGTETASARFELRAPRVPVGIQPFGCTSMEQWVR